MREKKDRSKTRTIFQYNNFEMNIKKLSIVIPVFNESKTIEKVIKRVGGADLGKIKRKIIKTKRKFLESFATSNCRIFLIN